MPQLPPLTPEEHQELARELRRCRIRMRELQELVLAVYGPANGAAVSFRRLVQSLDRVRADMQDQAARDYPGVRVDYRGTS